MEGVRAKKDSPLSGAGEGGTSEAGGAAAAEW